MTTDCEACCTIILSSGRTRVYSENPSPAGLSLRVCFLQRAMQHEHPRTLGTFSMPYQRRQQLARSVACLQRTAWADAPFPSLLPHQRRDRHVGGLAFIGSQLNPSYLRILLFSFIDSTNGKINNLGFNNPSWSLINGFPDTRGLLQI